MKNIWNILNYKPRILDIEKLINSPVFRTIDWSWSNSEHRLTIKYHLKIESIACSRPVSPQETSLETVLYYGERSWRRKQAHQLFPLRDAAQLAQLVRSFGKPNDRWPTRCQVSQICLLRACVHWKLEILTLTAKRTPWICSTRAHFAYVQNEYSLWMVIRLVATNSSITWYQVYTNED